MLESQYKEAADFLVQLCDEFVDSDRSRVVIVPGNHDVHWHKAKQAMQPLTKCPPNIASLSCSPTTNVRWSWTDQCAYEITDKAVYDARYQPYKNFVNSFYQDVIPYPVVGPNGDLFFAEYSDLNIAVIGLPSWCGNDCFCHVGHIDSSTMAACQRLIAETQVLVRVAVWHHGVVGTPNAMDYMNQRVVHKLIDYGFQVGLHGHQHLPGAAPFKLNLPNLTSMVVVGAGSIAVGDQELPMGERRQFNIVEINERANKVKVNVRAMSASGIFTRSHRDDFGGASFLTLPLPESTGRRRVRSSPSGTIANKMIEALGEKRYEDVLTLAPQLDESQASLNRTAKIVALNALGQFDVLVKLLDSPRNLDEALRRIAILIELRRWDDAEDQLDLIRGEISAGFHRELSEKITARRLLS